jgi:hypothetical protein
MLKTSEMDPKLAPGNMGPLYADRSSKYEQLLIRPFLTKNMSMAGSLNLKFNILFYGSNP